MGEMGRNHETKETKQPEIEEAEELALEDDGDPEEAREYIDNMFNGEIDSTEDTEPENPHEETRDGKTYYYDDNGEIYRVDDDLAPNTEYEINGYKYETDDLGRKTKAEGTLRIKDHEGRLSMKDTIQVIGKGDQKEGDHRGHLFADWFGGANGLENMIPQDGYINTHDYLDLEKELAKEVQAGKEVYVKIEVVYEEASHRPSALIVTYTIDGEESVRIFPNGQEV